MSNPYNPRKTDGAKRGGVKNRPDWNRSVTVAAQRIMDTGSTSGVLVNGKSSYTPAINTHFDGEETAEDFIIPRRSLTRKQYLPNFPQTVEVEVMSPIKRWQLATKGPNKGKLVYTEEENIRVTFKSSKNLLNQSKVDQFGTLNRKTGLREDRVHRVTSQSKRHTFTSEPLAADAFETVSPDNELD